MAQQGIIYHELRAESRRLNVANAIANVITFRPAFLLFKTISVAQFFSKRAISKMHKSAGCRLGKISNPFQNKFFDKIFIGG